jgi:hypothetical protein
LSKFAFELHLGFPGILTNSDEVNNYTSEWIRRFFCNCRNLVQLNISFPLIDTQWACWNGILWGR